MCCLKKRKVKSFFNEVFHFKHHVQLRTIDMISPGTIYAIELSNTINENQNTIKECP